MGRTVSAAADSVADAGCFAGEIVIETDQHIQLGECVIAGIYSPQRVGHGPGRIGDDERIPRISFGLPGIQICDAAHRQTWKVRDLVPAGSGDGDRQGADRVGLIDDDQQRPVCGEAVEHSAQAVLVIG